MASSANKSEKELILDLSDKYRRNNPSKNFLSEPMLHYILKNSSQKAYYKLIQMSKYFLVNEPPQIRKFERICYDGDWDNDPQDIFEVSGNRLWINSPEFGWHCSSVLVNGFLQRCFRIDVKFLQLREQKLTYDELKFLMESGNITFLELYQCKITHSNGKEVAIEDILKMVPLLEVFYYNSGASFTFSSQKVARLPKFYHLNNIELIDLAGNLCCGTFRNFLKKVPALTSGLFVIYYDVSPEHLRDIQIAVLKEVNPNIKVNCVEQVICFGDYYNDF